MDDDALQVRLRGIERRQNVMLALVVVLNLVAAAELFGYWITTVVATALALVGFAYVVVSRRRRRETVGT